MPSFLIRLPNLYAKTTRLRTKSAPTEAPIPIPAFSPVLKPDLGSGVRVGREVGELCVEIVRGVGGMSVLELEVVGDEVDVAV